MKGGRGGRGGGNLLPRERWNTLLWREEGRGNGGLGEKWRGVGREEGGRESDSGEPAKKSAEKSDEKLPKSARILKELLGDD